jgi:sterol desaturase/sphingolipid hydroxylase (fatty acid hydroxylase superfamily)
MFHVTIVLYITILKLQKYVCVYVVTIQCVWKVAVHLGYGM